MTLIEVVLALGIISFCLVSIMGLFPTMLDATRHSRDKALVQRMYQTVAENLHETPVKEGNSRIYTFDMEGLLLGISPARSGQTSPRTRYEVIAEDNSIAKLPETVINQHLILSRITFTDVVRNKTLLQRPIWTTFHD